jgi:hypothetical protein
MLSYKEFYYWLEGYLHGKLENEHIQITPIVEKMNEVMDINEIGVSKVNICEPPKLQPISIPTPKNPFNIKFKEEDFKND